MAITNNPVGQIAQYSLTTVTTTNWIKLHPRRNPWETSLSVYAETPSGLSATVEYTNHPDPDSAPAVAIRTAQFLDDTQTIQDTITDAITYLDGPLEWPIGYVRLNYGAGTGTVTLNVFQPGSA